MKTYQAQLTRLKYTPGLFVPFDHILSVFCVQVVGFIWRLSICVLALALSLFSRRLCPFSRNSRAVRVEFS